MSLSCVVGMHDIIWQQHDSTLNNYHKGERNPKATRKHYGVEQPEQIHFNVGTSLVNSVQVDQQDFVKTKFIKNNTSNLENKNIKSSHAANINKFLLHGKTGVTDGKWSVAIDDNQNPQVITYRYFSKSNVQN